MKLKSISIYMLSLAGMLGLWSCSTDEAIPEGGLVASGEKVPVTITISRGAQTRTELSENTTNGGLNQVWSEGDVVKLYDGNGVEAGTLTLQSGANTSDGIFTGNVKCETGTYRLWYFGKPQADAENPYPYLDFSTTKGQVKLDLQNQNFRSLDELEAVDILSTDVNIVVKDNQGTVGQTVTMNPHVAMARFTISGIPDGTSGTVKVYNNLNSDRGGIYAKQPLLLSTGVQQGGNTTTTSFTYDEVNNGEDIYVAFIPNAYTLHFEFETSEGAKFAYTFGQNNIEAGVYYQSFNKAEGEDTGTPRGIEVPFVIEKNSYDTSAWGADGEIIQPGYRREDIVFTYDWGWMNNQNSLPNYGGWATWITYTHNGKLASGLMVSDEITTLGAGKYFFQWGRYLGFNNLVGQLIYDPNGDASGTYYNSADPLGVDLDEQAVGVLGGLDYLKGTNGICRISGMTLKKSVDCSLVFARVSTSFGGYDYVSSNNNYWEERCGNPAPAGYKIPTTGDYKAIIPSECSISGKEYRIDGTHVEVKNYKGIKYAMKWTVVSGDMPALEVRSFVTDKSKVSANDAGFEKTIPISFKALGYLTTDNAKYTDSGKVGWFWASDTYTYEGTKYGAQLEINFNGSTATVSIQPCEQAKGLPVMLIKDDTKTPDEIEPLFPLSSAATSHIVGYPDDWYKTW